ncbi:MAG: hypothetical protein EA365_01670 [Gloeocapsa sp. DLM2.Bin57]|nr:MAG: hypothetical protein EA365_01670 [Gloeocapsa sp. DLM2.Bin57]
MSNFSDQLKPEERQKWLNKIAKANQNNIFCHCRDCDWEWVDSDLGNNCRCGSFNIERIACWQFPDD